ncbi:hypothetical protein CUJ84_pRLN3000373 (plasmid) [Rhizobium leguminosarum]|uniref:Uncharacterized protein n=1 Tax=Rhizobium leguminosarum TaxID=384 RepID=A0A2K9ZGX9_RHILE|nr:hypothetical protein CUJ84_pRLN3000373 [Rhizobium leguminosarum]
MFATPGAACQGQALTERAHILKMPQMRSVHPCTGWGAFRDNAPLSIAF